MSGERPAGPPAGNGSRLIGTSEGHHVGAFRGADWALLALIAGGWGSTFFFIDVSLDHLPPGVVASGRLLIGALALALVPGARAPVPRAAWPALALMSVVWLAAPIAVMPLAQQRVDSSFAGMMSGAVPLVAALVASLMLRRRPGRMQSFGLLVGFVGILVISIPGTAGDSASPLGTALMLIVVLCFGVGTNLAVPLSQRYGTIPVIFRAQVLAAVLLLPYGLVELPQSEIALQSTLALVALGLISGSLALVAMSALGSRVGAPRANIAVYFVPIVAIGLGLLLRDDSVVATAPLGIALVLVGAFFASRADSGAPVPPAVSSTPNAATPATQISGSASPPPRPRIPRWSRR